MTNEQIQELRTLWDENNAKGKASYVEEGEFRYEAAACNQLIPALDALEAERAGKNAAYLERNKLVALLASLFPSGIARTAIDGWSEDWHGCVYIDFGWGQASWHYHDSQAYLFDHLPPYEGTWDGHTTEEKYEKIVAYAKQGGKS